MTKNDNFHVLLYLNKKNEEKLKENYIIIEDENFKSILSFIRVSSLKLEELFNVKKGAFITEIEAYNFELEKKYYLYRLKI